MQLTKLIHDKGFEFLAHLFYVLFRAGAHKCITCTHRENRVVVEVEALPGLNRQRRARERVMVP